MQFRDLIFIALAGLGAGLGAGVAQGQPLRLILVGNVPTVTYLGAAFQDVSAERAKVLKLPEEAGVEVTFMPPGSPAAAAGLKVGDVVMEYNGQRVEGREQVARLVRETPAGREVTLQVYRNGSPQIIMVKLVSHPAMVIQGELVPTQPHAPPFQATLQDFSVNRMSWGNSVLGTELESLEGQLADYFGVKEGVLVRSVMRGSAAEKAGLRAGDVITHVGEAKVATPADVFGRIRADRAQSAMLTILRDHREMSLAIALDGNRLGQQ